MFVSRDLYNYLRCAKEPTRTHYLPSHDPGSISPVPPEDIYYGDPIPAKRFTTDERDAILLRTTKAHRTPLYVRHIDATDPPGNRSMAVRANDLGIKYLNFDLPRAFRAFLDAVDLDHTFAPAHNNLGLTRLELGDLDNSIRDLNQALSLDETMDAAYTNRGLARLELNRPEEAYQDFLRAISIAPTDATHHNNAGVLFLDFAEPGLALRFFDQAISLQPDDSIGHRNRALALQEMGDHAQARQEFDTADSIDDQQLNSLMETS